MPALRPGFLSKKGGQWRAIRLIDLVCLLWNAHRGAAHPEVGWEDTEETLDTYTKKLNRGVFVPKELIESGLWSCSLLDEQGEFWHPRGLTFEQFVDKVRRRDKFDRRYHLITKEEKK